MGRAVALLLAFAVTGCGSRCKDVRAARTALTSRIGASNRGSDIEVTWPLARANTLIAEILQQQSLTVPLDVPDLGPLEISTQLTATVKQMTLQPGPPGRVRFAVRLEVDDPAQEVTTIDAIAEIEPILTRASGGAQLTIGIGPQNVIKLVPELGPDASAKLGGAITRWVPARVKDRVPQPLLDAAAKRLGGHLTGDAWTVLQKTLLTRLGAMTALKLRLPDVPVARVDLSSRTSPDMLVVAITTDLPVRAGLAPLTTPPSELSVRIAGSAAAELANWAIDTKLAPQWYTRSLKPAPGGEFRPRLDYVPGTSHPIKVYVFQERGGCSYFRVDVRAKVEMSGGKLVATATDRDLEGASANWVIEAAAAISYFLTGWVDQSNRIAAQTQLTIGGRTLLTEVISAELTHDELAFGLQFSPASR